MSNDESLTNYPLSPAARNNQIRNNEENTLTTRQHHNLGNLVSLAPVNIDRSDINQVTPIDNVENLHIHQNNEQHIHIHLPPNSTNLQLQGSQIQSSQLPGSQIQGSQLQGSELQGSQLQGSQVPRSQIGIHQQPATSSNTESNDPEGFVEDDLRCYMVESEFFFKDMSSTVRYITDEMYEHTPIAHQTSFLKLSKNNGNSITGEGTTKLSVAFPMNEDEASFKRLVAVTGEPGSGKSVYLTSLQSYYIKEGFFVFRFDFVWFKMINGKIKFPDLVLRSCPNFPCENPKQFGRWLPKNEKRCIFLLDGLDQAPDIVEEIFLPANIGSSATVGVWISMLVSKKIMRKSKVVVSSRPSSIFNLPSPLRPEVIYNLNGLSDEGMSLVVSTYNRENSQQILKFIKDKGQNLVSFTRNPFLLSLISLIYNPPSSEVTSTTTLTQLYTFAFKYLKLSAHNRKRGDQESEKSIDKFYFEMFMSKKNSFTEEDLRNNGLTVEQMENFTFINVTSKQISHVLEFKEKMITPRHQTLMEYHLSRYIIQHMDMGDFKGLVEGLYDLLDQDRWVYIRRFMAGHINTKNVDEEKRKFFLNRLIEKMKDSQSSSVFERYGFGYDLAMVFQARLYNDLAELPNELDFIRSCYSGKTSETNLQVHVEDERSIEGPIFFLEHVKPNLQFLDIFLSEHTGYAHFLRFSNSVKSLSNGIKRMNIISIHFARRQHVECIKLILPKINAILHLSYHKESNVDIDYIERRLQMFIDEFTFKRAFIAITYRARYRLIRHSSYTSATSSLAILPSHLDPEKKTINLAKCKKPFLETVLSELDIYAKRGFCYDFIIAHEDEVKILVEMLMIPIPIFLLNIRLYPPSGITSKYWEYVRMLLQHIAYVALFITQLHVHNLSFNDIGLKEILSLLPKIQNSLVVKYLDELTDTQKEEWKKKLEDSTPLITFPTLDVDLTFTNCQIKWHSRIHEWTFTPAAYT